MGSFGKKHFFHSWPFRYFHGQGWNAALPLQPFQLRHRPTICRSNFICSAGFFPAPPWTATPQPPAAPFQRFLPALHIVLSATRGFAQMLVKKRQRLVYAAGLLPQALRIRLQFQTEFLQLLRHQTSVFPQSSGRCFEWLPRSVRPPAPPPGGLRPATFRADDFPGPTLPCGRSDLPTSIHQSMFGEGRRLRHSPSSTLKAISPDSAAKARRNRQWAVTT